MHRHDRDTELCSEGEHPVLARSDPLPSEVDGSSVMCGLGEGSAADPIPGLTDHDIDADLHEPAGGDQTGKPGSDHDGLAPGMRLTLHGAVGGSGSGAPW
jgi:hypothetical protein